MFMSCYFVFCFVHLEKNKYKYGPWLLRLLCKSIKVKINGHVSVVHTNIISNISSRVIFRHIFCAVHEPPVIFIFGPLAIEVL